MLSPCMKCVEVMILNYILQTCCSITQSIPQDEPALVTPNFEKLDLPTLQKAIPKSGLRSIEILWWNDFVEKLLDQQHKDAGVWVLNEVISLHQSLAVPAPQSSTSLPTLLVEIVSASTQAITS